MGRLIPEPSEKLDVDIMVWWSCDFIDQLEKGGAGAAAKPDSRLPILSFDASDLTVMRSIRDLLHALNLVRDDPAMRAALKRGYAGVHGQPLPPVQKRWGRS
jgi:hypothetical protein